MRYLSGNGPHLAWKGEPPGFSQVAAGALDLRRGPQGPALVASGKASPLASCSGASRGSLRFPLPSMLGPKTLCGVSAGTSGFLSSADTDLGVLLKTPQGSRSLSRVRACTCAFLPSCSSGVALPFTWIKGSVAYPRGFPTTLSHRALPRATVV